MADDPPTIPPVTEGEIDAVLREAKGDALEAIRMLLWDLVVRCRCRQAGLLRRRAGPGAVVEGMVIVQRSKRSVSPGKIEEMQREVKACEWKARGWAAEVPTAVRFISASIRSTTHYS